MKKKNIYLSHQCTHMIWMEWILPHGNGSQSDPIIFERFIDLFLYLHVNFDQSFHLCSVYPYVNWLSQHFSTSEGCFGNYWINVYIVFSEHHIRVTILVFCFFDCFYWNKYHRMSRLATKNILFASNVIAFFLLFIKHFN